ncbi:hypothetical protein FG386_000519 [Cryptosporidium ryanae]|uniref:uncharacterized protein n=1 Tax=Cryptosporidium ryanae TaxID=515981 RepID=UPI00351AB0CE|nr:hypothetical protein FG386_000519 [Cryptosporidium ryanae]
MNDGLDAPLEEGEFASDSSRADSLSSCNDDELSRKLAPFKTNLEFDETELPEETRQIIHQNTGTLLKSLTFSNSGGLKGAIERSYLIRQQSLSHSKEEVVDAYKQRARLAAMVSRRRVTLQHIKAQLSAISKFKKGIKQENNSLNYNEDEDLTLKRKSKTDIVKRGNSEASYDFSDSYRRQGSSSITPVRFGSMSISDAIALQQLANVKIGTEESE